MEYLHFKRLYIFCYYFISFFFIIWGQICSASVSESSATSVSSVAPARENNCEAELKICKIKLVETETFTANLQSELKIFKQNHETSMKACTYASERQTADLNNCKKQSVELSQKFNIVQEERMNLKKQVLELESKIASKEHSDGGDLKKIKEEAASAKKKVEELEASQNSLKAQYDKIVSKQQNEFEKKKVEAEIAKQQLKEYKKRTDKIISEMHVGGGSHDSQNNYMFSKNILYSSVSSVFQFYRSLTLYLISFVPEETWIKADNAYTQVKEAFQEYLKVAYPYTEIISGVAISQYNTVSSLYEQHINPIVNKQVEILVVLLTRGADSTGHYLEKMNGYLDEKLENYFVAHPDMRTLIPATFLDRVLCLIFVVVMLFLGFKVACLSLKYIVVPVISSIFTCCRKRRITKSTKNQKVKKFTPAATHATVKKFKEGNNCSPTPTKKINA